MRRVQTSRRAGGLGTLALIAASVLAPLSARAAEREIDGGTVAVTVRIDLLECVTGCDGAPLPATGSDLPTMLIWVGAALLAVGLAFALRARASRLRGAQPTSAPATPYAVVSGNRAPLAGSGGSVSSAPAPSPAGGGPVTVISNEVTANV